MHYPLIIFAALTVSADTLATGVYLGASKCNPIKTILTVPLCSFVLCLAAVWLGTFIDLSFAVLIGGIILIAIGANNIISSKKTESLKASKRAGFVQILLLGLSLSVDNAVTAFSFGTFDYNCFAVAAIFSSATLLFLVSGILVSRIRVPRFFMDISFAPGLIILLIGLSKIFGFFF